LLTDIQGVQRVQKAMGEHEMSYMDISIANINFEAREEKGRKQKERNVVLNLSRPLQMSHEQRTHGSRTVSPPNLFIQFLAFASMIPKAG